ncbi:MAG: TorF family putative porin [Burkholderiaceae bacterium]|nr:TorF family putative porin [Burkholderiaceae bacterium]
MYGLFSRIHRSVLWLGLAGAACAANAQTAATPEHDFSFNLGLTTDNRYRGISQSRLKPAISGGLDYAHSSGLYVGTWLTSIKWVKDAGGDADFEWDVYGGYGGTAGALGYDVGFLHYNFPSHKLSVSPNTTEIYGALSWDVVTVKYSHSVTNLFGYSDSKNSGYLEASATFDLGSGWSVTPHVGHQWIRHNSDFAYTDYSIGVSKDLGGGFVVSATALGSNADKALYVTPKGKFTGRTALVVGVKYTF